MSRYKVLCLGREWPQQGLYCRDRFWPPQENLVATGPWVRSDMRLYVRQSFGQDQGFSCRDRIFLCRDRVWLGQEFFVLIDCLYFVTKLAMVERLYVATGLFLVATETV